MDTLLLAHANAARVCSGTYNLELCDKAPDWLLQRNRVSATKKATTQSRRALACGEPIDGHTLRSVGRASVDVNMDGDGSLGICGCRCLIDLCCAQVG